MKLVERRIGLLFALFLLLLGAATARATWIGTVKAGSLGDRAVQQQVEDMTVPARRGARSSTATAWTLPCRRTRSQSWPTRS